jgi:hypothetical protein
MVRSEWLGWGGGQNLEEGGRCWRRKKNEKDKRKAQPKGYTNKDATVAGAPRTLMRLTPYVNGRVFI